MKIIDKVINEIATFNDDMDAYREARSRVQWYKKQGIETEIVDANLETIEIRRKAWKKFAH